MKSLSKLIILTLLAIGSINVFSQTTLFFDNCNTMGNWTNTGRRYPVAGGTHNWQSVDPTVPSDDHTGGGNCLYINGNSNYAEAQDGNYILYQIQSSAIDLTGWNNTRLEFWMQMRSETGNWDGGFVEWSHNGTSWNLLNTELCVPYDGNISQNDAAGPFFPNMKPAWFNPKTSWTRILANLSNIDNVPAFYLRFTFLSDELANDRGWAIDDIKIVSIATLQLQGNSIVIPVTTAPIAANNTDFGGCSVGQFIDKEFFIHNTGESPLSLTGNPLVTTTGNGFSVLTQPATNTIAPGQSVPFTVRFQPTSIGNFNGTINIPNADSYSTCGVAPAVYNIKASSTNTPPQMTGLADVTACPGAGPINIPFMVADVEQNPNVVTFTGTSSNQTIIPNANISFTGTGANREVIFTALPGQVGNVTLTITANDGQPVNNTSTATVNVLLQDNIPPVALCQNVTVQLDSNGNGSITAQQVNNGSSDNCLLGLLSVSQSQFSCADVGVLNLIFDAADGVGNTSQCLFDATVLPPLGSLTLQSPEFVGGKEISCNGANDGIINAQAQGGCGPYTYSWAEIPALTGAQATNLTAGTYHVQATDAAGQIWDAQITLEEPQALADLSISANVSCFGKSDGKITLDITGGTPPYSYSSGPNITSLAAGNYDYTMTDTNGCSISTSYIILEPTQIILNVSPSVTVQCGEQIPLIAEAFNGTGEFSYLWTGPGVECANCSNAYAIASESAAYEVVATDENGCFNVAQVISEVNCNVYIPNAFTPSNGDMVNPSFLVYTGNVKDFSFSVYDRWGQLVFSSQNPDMGWNGYYGDKAAAQGVYIYKLNYRFPGGKEDMLFGRITLIGGN